MCSTAPFIFGAPNDAPQYGVSPATFCSAQKSQSRPAAEQSSRSSLSLSQLEEGHLWKMSELDRCRHQQVIESAVSLAAKGPNPRHERTGRDSQIISLLVEMGHDLQPIASILKDRARSDGDARVCFEELARANNARSLSSVFSSSVPMSSTEDAACFRGQHSQPPPPLSPSPMQQLSTPCASADNAAAAFGCWQSGQSCASGYSPPSFAPRPPPSASASAADSHLTSLVRQTEALRDDINEAMVMVDAIPIFHQLEARRFVDCVHEHGGPVKEAASCFLAVFNSAPFLNYGVIVGRFVRHAGLHPEVGERRDAMASALSSFVEDARRELSGRSVEGTCTLDLTTPLCPRAAQGAAGSLDTSEEGDCRLALALAAADANQSSPSIGTGVPDQEAADVARATWNSIQQDRRVQRAEGGGGAVSGQPVGGASKSPTLFAPVPPDVSPEQYQKLVQQIGKGIGQGGLSPTLPAAKASGSVPSEDNQARIAAFLADALCAPQPHSQPPTAPSGSNTNEDPTQALARCARQHGMEVQDAPGGGIFVGPPGGADSSRASGRSSPVGGCLRSPFSHPRPPTPPPHVRFKSGASDGGSSRGDGGSSRGGSSSGRRPPPDRPSSDAGSSRPSWSKTGSDVDEEDAWDEFERSEYGGDGPSTSPSGLSAGRSGSPREARPESEHSGTSAGRKRSGFPHDRESERSGSMAPPRSRPSRGDIAFDVRTELTEEYLIDGAGLTSTIVWYDYDPPADKTPSSLQRSQYTLLQLYEELLHREKKRNRRVQVDSFILTPTVISEYFRGSPRSSQSYPARRGSFHTALMRMRLDLLPQSPHYITATERVVSVLVAAARLVSTLGSVMSLISTAAAKRVHDDSMIYEILKIMEGEFLHDGDGDRIALSLVKWHPSDGGCARTAYALLTRLLELGAHCLPETEQNAEVLRYFRSHVSTARKLEGLTRDPVDGLSLADRVYSRYCAEDARRTYAYTSDLLGALKQERDIGKSILCFAEQRRLPRLPPRGDGHHPPRAPLDDTAVLNDELGELLLEELDDGADDTAAAGGAPGGVPVELPKRSGLAFFDIDLVHSYADECSILTHDPNGRFVFTKVSTLPKPAQFNPQHPEGLYGAPDVGACAACMVRFPNARQSESMKDFMQRTKGPPSMRNPVPADTIILHGADGCLTIWKSIEAAAKKGRIPASVCLPVDKAKRQEALERWQASRG